MKKSILISLCFLTLLNAVYGWGWETHQMFAEKTYNSMPSDLREKLNLTAMKEGAIAPDKDFHDNIKHHYPPSYELALKWLNFSCDADCDYNNVSYNSCPVFINCKFNPNRTKYGSKQTRKS